MSVFDEPKIDCHCHVLDPVRYAYGDDVFYRPVAQEIGPVEQYLQVMDAYGIRHALLVGPNSGYGNDNRCLLDALDRDDGRFKGIALVPLEIDRAGLIELRSRGVIGLAFNATLMGTAHYLRCAPLLRMLADLDMMVSLQVEGDQLAELRDLFDESGVHLLVDHCGRPVPGRGIDQPGFRALLAMARSGRVAVKLSGWQKFSAGPPPFGDVLPYCRALIDAFGLDACLWASDWPYLRAPHRLDVGPVLRQFERLLPDAADRRRVFWDAPLRWLGLDTR